MRILSAVLVLLLTWPAYANDCEIAHIVDVPCRGVLLPAEFATKGIQCIEVEVPRLKAECEKETTQLTARIEALQTGWDATSTKAAKTDKLLAEAQEKINKLTAPVPWYKTKLFVYGLGVASGVGVILGGAYTVDQVR